MLPSRSTLLACVALAFGSAAAGAQQMPDMPGMDHHHHHSEVAATSQEKLGDVHFPVSCAAAEQTPFNRGVALLHSFGYTNADAQFRAIAKADPECAMAHWGIAMSQFHELWGRPDADAIKTGTDEMAKARSLAAAHKVTAREQDYLGALGAFYDLAGTDYQSAADAYVSHMAALHAAYPQDIEGAAFYALSLLADVAPDDTSLTKERKALAVLVPLFHEHPDHPGLAHYIIHTCDTPALAGQGLEAAKVYARIAPSSPHALHMPGHIFARLGLWQEDIDSNLASVGASEQDERAGVPGTAHQMHADEFLIYAYLQTGQDAKARELTMKMDAVGKHMAAMPGMDDMKDSGNWFANELNAIYLMEMHDWPALAKLKPVPGSTPSDSMIVVWGNGVAAGHLHDAAIVDASLAKLDQGIDAVKNTPRAYMVEYLQVPRKELLGWKLFCEGKNDAAVASMRAAAEQQDKLGQGEVDIPADEMVGDLLSALGESQEALAEYKLALHYSPNRLNTLLDAGTEAEALGDEREAAQFYAQAARNTDDGKDTQRAAVAHAVAFTRSQTTMAARR
jgi:tetratricopeptide (TPR) repeat protein